MENNKDRYIADNGSPEHATAYIPLERLRLGIDNLRYDVYLSPELSAAASPLLVNLIVKYSGVSTPLQPSSKVNWFKEISRFKQVCLELMKEAESKAKAASEVQIDYLAQVAVVKKLLAEVEKAFDQLQGHFKDVIRKQEIAHRTESVFALKEEITSVVSRKSEICQKTAAEFFTYFNECRQEIDTLREADFGRESLLAGELFENPLLFSFGRPSERFMMDHYILLGHRLEDPLNYANILQLLEKSVQFHVAKNAASQDIEQTCSTILPHREAALEQLRIKPESDLFLRKKQNIEELFDIFKTTEEIQKAKAKKEDKEKIEALKKRFSEQKRRLLALYKAFRKENIMDAVIAAYMIEEAGSTYCPPLSYNEILQYISSRKSRKTIARKIKRFNRFSGSRISVAPLRRMYSRIRRTGRKKRLMALVRFLYDFTRYHRDLNNYIIFKETMECINILEEPKQVELSRGNNTLYEFVLAKEVRPDQSSVLRHVVLKADVRGSTEMIKEMKEKGLNPATNLSMNFYDPITGLLSEYGAKKVFIEGDALIISIFEYADAPEDWYAVARACGLAVNMMMILHRYNKENKDHGLPPLEIGIGISLADEAPTIFFDENTQVLISPAINEADRLSSCDRVLMNYFAGKKLPFRLYLFAVDPAEAPENPLIPNPILRYNVMGIELSEPAFAKLADEIHLQRIECRIPEIHKEPIIVHTGKFPTKSGSFQRIIVREARIPTISPRSLAITGISGRSFYEVIYHPRIYDYVKSRR